LQQLWKIRILIKYTFIDWVHVLLHFLPILIVFIIDFLGLSDLLVRLALSWGTIAGSIRWSVLLAMIRACWSWWRLYGNWSSCSLALISNSHASIVTYVFAVYFIYLVLDLLLCALTSVYSSCWLGVFVVVTSLPLIF